VATNNFVELENATKFDKQLLDSGKISVPENSRAMHEKYAECLDEFWTDCIEVRYPYRQDIYEEELPEDE
jgi:hypothetical protein